MFPNGRECKKIQNCWCGRQRHTKMFILLTWFQYVEQIKTWFMTPFDPWIISHLLKCKCLNAEQWLITDCLNTHIFIKNNKHSTKIPPLHLSAGHTGLSSQLSQNITFKSNYYIIWKSRNETQHSVKRTDL